MQRKLMHSLPLELEITSQREAHVGHETERA